MVTMGDLSGCLDERSAILKILGNLGWEGAIVVMVSRILPLVR
jgi:hypothetical protein